MHEEGSALERLELAMTETSRAIRCGDLTKMAGLAARTEAALAELQPETDAVRIVALRDLAQRNATGLEAAGRGVRAARRRLAEITAARSGGKTYDNAGNTQKIGTADGALKARF